MHRMLSYDCMRDVMLSYFLQVCRALCAGCGGGAAAWAIRGELLLLLLHASQSLTVKHYGSNAGSAGHLLLLLHHAS
jgi:hypothetical protein